MTVAHWTLTLGTPWNLLNVRFEIREVTELLALGRGFVETEILWSYEKRKLWTGNGETEAFCFAVLVAMTASDSFLTKSEIHFEGGLLMHSLWH